MCLVKENINLGACNKRKKNSTPKCEMENEEVNGLTIYLCLYYFLS